MNAAPSSVASPDAPASPPSPPRKVVIAGLGLVSPLGHGAWSTFRALLGGATVADRLPPLLPDTAPLPLAQAVGGVSLARQSPDDPACDLAERAAREAAAEAGVSLPGLAAWLGTSKGAVTAWTRAADARARRCDVPPALAACVALGPHGFLANHLTTRAGLAVRGHAVAACASGLTALHQAFTTLQRGGGNNPTQALVISSESALLPAFVHSYRRLGVLAPATHTAYRGRPLDQQRRGFVLGEAGAAVLLRALPEGTAPSAGDTELLATAQGTDPTHLMRCDPAMATFGNVAQQLAAAVGRPFAALHPHAPGTADHDPAELAVLDRLMGNPDAPVPTYAVKGALGHTLGASGLVSLVIAALCARAARIPPMPWLDQPLLTPGLSFSSRPAPLPVGPHAVFSAGFGGHLAGAALTRADS